jgi:hypothetical protein
MFPAQIGTAYGQAAISGVSLPCRSIPPMIHVQPELAIAVLAISKSNHAVGQFFEEFSKYLTLGGFGGLAQSDMVPLQSLEIFFFQPLDPEPGSRETARQRRYSVCFGRITIAIGVLN